MTSTDHPPGGGHHYTDEEMHNADIAHERAEVNIRAVLGFAVALMVVVSVAAGLMYGLFALLERQAAARDPQISPHAVTDAQPKGPRLLTSEPQNLRRFREEETGKLEGSGWMNQSGGVAHVPVEFAKKMIVQHGLPVRADATADPAVGTHAPAYGESSGGRAIPVRPAAAAPPAGAEPHAADARHPGDAQHPAPSAGQEIKK